MDDEALILLAEWCAGKTGGACGGCLTVAGGTADGERSNPNYIDGYLEHNKQRHRKDPPRSVPAGRRTGRFAAEEPEFAKLPPQGQRPMSACANCLHCSTGKALLLTGLFPDRSFVSEPFNCRDGRMLETYPHRRRYPRSRQLRFIYRHLLRANASEQKRRALQRAAR